MLIGINQKSQGLLRVIQKYGCLFLCMAHASPVIFEGEDGIKKLNGLWEEAVSRKIISGDINRDGDFDDGGEAEVMSHTSLFQQILGSSLTYDGKHHGTNEEIPSNVKVVIGQYFWKGSHFVLLDKTLKVVFDPLGESNTVKNGFLKTTRWYKDAV